MSDITLNCGFSCSSVDGCQGHCERAASADTLPKGQDAQQGLAGTESGAVPSEDSADAQ